MGVFCHRIQALERMYPDPNVGPLIGKSRNISLNIVGVALLHPNCPLKKKDISFKKETWRFWDGSFWNWLGPLDVFEDDVCFRDLFEKISAVYFNLSPMNPWVQWKMAAQLKGNDPIGGTNF